MSERGHGSMGGDAETLRIRLLGGFRFAFILGGSRAADREVSLRMILLTGGNFARYNLIWPFRALPGRDGRAGVG